MILVDLSKQQALDADPKAIQRINFTSGSRKHRIEQETQEFISFLKREKKLFLNFHKEQ